MSTLTRRVLRVPAFIWVMGGMALGAVLLDRHRDGEAAARAAASMMAPPALAARSGLAQHSVLPAHPLAAAAAPAPPPQQQQQPSPAADLSYLSTLHPAGATALK